MRYAVGLSSLLGAVLWAQIESPNSFLALAVGTAVPSGPTAATGLRYPTHGYMRSGALVGLYLNTQVAPYFGINLQVRQAFLPLDAKALGKNGALFPEPVSLSKSPSVSHTLVGFGVSGGIRWDWISLYVPIQFALGIYSAPEMQGIKSATQEWVQPKFSAVQTGLSTGLVANFSITDDFFAGLSFLYMGLRSGEQEFERTRYTRGQEDWIFRYRAPVRTELGEVGVLVGLNF